MYKCKICGKKYTDLSSLYNHIENKHPDMIPKDMCVQQYYYYMKTGRTHGNCVMCKQATTWNKNTNKYNRFCGNPKCKDEYVRIMKNRMIAKYGKVHLLNDPEKQREMLSKRKISGTYKWSDSKFETTYTGSYELDFLKTLDLFFDWDPQDVSMPSPHTYTYKYEGEDKFYIPDAFIHSLDLEIEIKDGGDNPNNHHKIQAVDKEKEKLKDEVMLSQKNFHYIKITNKNYTNFLDFLKEIKEAFEKYGEDKKIPRIFKIEDIKSGTTVKPVNEALDIVDESAFKDAIKGAKKDFINNLANGLKTKKVPLRNNEVFFSLQYDLRKDQPLKLKEYLNTLVKSAHYEDDIRFVKELVGKSDTYYHNLLKKRPELQNEYDEYYNWVTSNDGLPKEIKDKMKKIKESLETIEEKFEPDKFLVWFDKPIQKALGRKIKLYHGSTELIDGDVIEPISFNVGATKYSDPRWSTYFWDNKEDAMKWVSAIVVNDVYRYSVYIGHNGKTLIGKPKDITDREAMKEIVRLTAGCKFYVYEVEIDIDDLEIGSCPSIKEYTVSKPVNIVKRYNYEINPEILRRFFTVTTEEEVKKFREQGKTVKNLKLHRNVILNNILDNTRDSYRGIMRTDLKQGNIKVGDDLSQYKDSINYHVKKDSYGLKEANEELLYESSISFYYINKCLQNGYEEELKHYLDTYKQYYNKMLDEKPHSIPHINEDIKKAIIFIDGLSNKGVENNLIQFAKSELGDIVNLAKNSKPCRIFESKEIEINNNDLVLNEINMKLVFDQNKTRNLFGMNDLQSQIQLENYIIQRDRMGNHCSINPGIVNENDKKIVECQLIFKEPVNINISLKEKMEEGIILNSLFNINDKDYKFIKETSLRLFGVYPDSIKIK